MRALVTGAAGSLAHKVATSLSARHEVVGVDVRPLPGGRAFPGPFVQLKRYDSRPTAEVFREHQPDTLVHLGIRGFSPRTLTKRYTQNVMGTKKLLDLAVKHGVKRVLVLSTHHVYGAHQYNPVNIREDAPLRASQVFPELADSVELDHLATTFLWQHRDIPTVVLRPANVVGPHIRNRISRLLRMDRVPKLLGYDPMLQFIHDEDFRAAILLALESDLYGVFNVAGEGVAPWSHSIWMAGGHQLVIPRAAVRLLPPRYSRTFPRHLRDFFRYHCVIDDRAFRAETGFRPTWSTVDALGSIRG